MLCVSCGQIDNRTNLHQGGGRHSPEHAVSLLRDREQCSFDSGYFFGSGRVGWHGKGASKGLSANMIEVFQVRIGSKKETMQRPPTPWLSASSSQSKDSLVSQCRWLWWQWSPRSQNVSWLSRTHRQRKGRMPKLSDSLRDWVHRNGRFPSTEGGTR